MAVFAAYTPLIDFTYTVLYEAINGPTAERRQDLGKQTSPGHHTPIHGY